MIILFAIVRYREWAPAALAVHLTGDFVGWDRNAVPCTKDEFGVWSVRLPDTADGTPAIPDGSKVKVRSEAALCA